MNIEDLSENVLKDLIFEYKSTNDPKVFEKILFRIDMLLVYITKKLIFSFPQLQKENPDEIYQTVVASLLRSFQKIQKEDSFDKIVAKIIAYAKLEIKSIFCKSWAVDYRKRGSCSISEYNEICSGLEGEFLRSLYNKIIERNVISKSDFELIEMHVVEGMNFTKIAEIKGIPMQNVRTRILNGMLRLRHQLRNMGVTPDEK